MLKYVWFLVFAIPPWLAVKFDASKLIMALSIAPFFIFAVTLDDPDEDLLGDASGTFRKGALVVMGAGGLALGVVLLILWQVLFPGA